MFLLILISINCIALTILRFDNMFILSALLSCNEMLLILIINEIVETIVLKRKYEKLNYNELDKFKYFRELLKEYSISELGIIYNNRINSNILISLEIVNMLKKDKIKIDNNTVIIKNRENLNFIQEHLLNMFRFIDLPSAKKEYKRKLRKNLENKNILKTLSNQANSINIFICVVLFIIIFGITLTKENWLSIYGIISFVIFWIELLILMVVFSQYSINIKTKTGQEIYLKLVGLKNYLRDFSNFEEKQLKEITLWDDYILYAVILNESMKIKKETLDIFEQISKNAKNGSLKVIDLTKKAKRK